MLEALGNTWPSCSSHLKKSFVLLMFNVLGTPFEAMFALPQAPTDDDSNEGSSLENPIHLPGIKVEHFRSFLRILYPLCVLMMTLSFKHSWVSLLIKYFSIDQTPVVAFDEWIGVLNLATMWFFQEVRSFALTEIFCALIYKYLLRSG